MTLIGKSQDGSDPTGSSVVAGVDGSGNAQDMLTDTDGHLQVDVLSGGGGGTLVTDGEAVDGADTGGLVLGTDGSNYQILSTDSSGHLQVDILSGGGGTQYAEDAVHNSGDTGTMALAVRNDTLAALAGTDGDYAPLQVNASGALFTEVTGTATVDNGGTFAVQVDGDALTALQLIDDAVHTDDAAFTLGTSKGVMMMGFAGTQSVNANDAGAIAMDTDGAIHISDGGNTITVDGTVTANLSATDNAVLDAIQAAVEVIDNAISGSEMQVDIVSSATLTVDLGSNNDVTATGNVAHDAADSGNPVKLGHKAVDIGSNPTEVAASDRTDWYANRAGVPFVIGGHPNILNASINVTDADGAQTDTAIVTVGAGEAICVTHIAATCDNANTGDVQCRVGFGTANTPAEDAAKQVLNHPGIAAGGGMVVGSGAGIIGQGAANEDLRITCEDPAGGSLSVNVSYFTIAA